MNLIREHILQHKRQKLPCPTNLTHLYSLIQAQQPPPKCTCDLCNPAPHTSFWNCPSPHFHIKLKTDITPNWYEKPCYRPLQLGTIFRCEAMHLAQTVVEYFDKPKEDLNTLQLEALHELNKWLKPRLKHILGPSTLETDRENLVPAKEMHQLWRWTNDIFFAGSSWFERFRWKRSLDDRRRGRASRRWFIWSIDMNPTVPTHHSLGGSIMLDVLSRLLHEAVHMFLLQYACGMCRTASLNPNIAGHGRVWQLLASRVQSTFIRLTGLPVDLGGFDALVRHWKFVYPLPSLHDLSEWRFEDADLVQMYCRDLLREYRRCKRPECFLVRDFCRDWWARSWRKRGHAAAVRRSVEDGMKQEEHGG
ncbi:hypothetical protein P153DRAFT_405539, partial [Dothidotthia symphoricarpi CBS 119687]